MSLVSAGLVRTMVNVASEDVGIARFAVRREAQFQNGKE